MSVFNGINHMPGLPLAFNQAGSPEQSQMMTDQWLRHLKAFDNITN